MELVFIEVFYKIELIFLNEKSFKKIFQNQPSLGSNKWFKVFVIQVIL